MSTTELMRPSGFAAVFLIASLTLAGCGASPSAPGSGDSSSSSSSDADNESTDSDSSDSDAAAACPDGLIDSLASFGEAYGVEYVEISAAEFDAPGLGAENLARSCLFSIKTEATFSHSAAVPGLVREQLIATLLSNGYRESDVVEGQYFLEGVGTRLELDEFASGAESDFILGPDSADFYEDGFVYVTVFPKE